MEISTIPFHNWPQRKSPFLLSPGTIVISQSEIKKVLAIPSFFYPELEEFNLSEDGLPENVKRFIFEFIDSVELLDILLLLNSDRQKIWNSNGVSGDLRANTHSVDLRLQQLKKWGFIEEPAPGEYRYNSGNPERNLVIDELASLNATKRHRILRLIFSPLKQIRALADGFRVSSKKPKGGETDG